MTDLNINSNRSQTQNIHSGEVIVIKKGSRKDATSDQMESLSSTTVEVKVPPADYPTLGAPNYANKPTTPPPSTQDPKTLFNQAFNQALNNADFSKATLGDLSPDEAKNQIAYALSHPGVKLDPNVTKLFNQLVDQAQQQTRQDTGNDSWTYQPQPSQDDINQSNSDNFNMLLNQAKLSSGDKKALTYTFNNPSNASKLSDKLQGEFNIISTQAQMLTQEEFGMNDLSAIQDNPAFQTTLNEDYEDNFKELINSIKPSELRGSVLTLFYHPTANVQQKTLAQQFLAQYQQKAAAETANKFNLPAGVTLTPDGAEGYDAMLKDAFPNEFKSALSEYAFKDAGVFQFAKQIAGLGPGPQTNLSPPALQAAYNMIRNIAIGKMKQDYGLPPAWSPENNDLGPVAGEDEEGDGEVTTSSEGTDETQQAWNSTTVNNQITNKVKWGIPIIGDSDPAPRDYSMANGALQYASDQADGVRYFAQNFLNGNDQISILNAMGAVSQGLSKLRETVYACEIRESMAAKAISRMQQAIQTDKNRLDELQRQKAEKQAHKKEFALFKVIEKLLPGIGKLVVDAMKLMLWVVDTCTGGLISMITQAAGIQPITKNPLLAMGLISKSQAAKMDMAMQIIAMVVEMAISIITAQPELMALLVGRMIAEIAQAGGEVALKVGIQVAEKAAQAAVESGVKEGMQEVVQTSVKQALKQTLEDSLKGSVKAGSKGAKYAQYVTEASEEWLDKTAENITQIAMKEAEKNAAQDVGRAGARVATREAAQASVESAAEQALRQAQANAKVLGKISEEMEEEFRASVKALIKGTKKAFGKAALGSVLPNIMFYNDIIQGLGQVVGNVAQIPQHLREARRAMELARIKADVALINSTYQSLQKSGSAILDGVAALGKWIGQINQQQAQFWKKAQIRFVKA